MRCDATRMADDGWWMAVGGMVTIASVAERRSESLRA